MVTPSQTGTEEAMILISGRQESYQKSEAILKTLAGNTLYLGEKTS